MADDIQINIAERLMEVARNPLASIGNRLEAGTLAIQIYKEQGQMDRITDAEKDAKLPSMVILQAALAAIYLLQPTITAKPTVDDTRILNKNNGRMDEYYFIEKKFPNKDIRTPEIRINLNYIDKREQIETQGEFFKNFELLTSKKAAGNPEVAQMIEDGKAFLSKMRAAKKVSAPIDRSRALVPAVKR